METGKTKNTNVIKIFFKILFFVFLIPTILAGSILFLEVSGFFNIGSVRVELANPEFQRNYAQPLANQLAHYLQDYQGKSLWRIDLVEIGNKLNTYNWIEQVSVKRLWPSQLKVLVKIKPVKALLMSAQGKLLPVVDDGEILQSVEVRQAPDVIMFIGDHFEKQIRMRKQALQIVEEIPPSGSFSRKTISEIHYNEKDGFWIRMMKDGLKIKFGTEHFAIKAARVNQVLDYLETRQIKAKTLDANLSKKVLVKQPKVTGSHAVGDNLDFASE